MDLILTVIRCPDSVVPEERRVAGGDYVIGRGADANWVLPDPDRLLSKHHCVLEFRGGGWQVRDLSTNGTFVNHADQPVGRDQVRPLEDGDRLRLGPYEIEVRLAMGGAQAPGAAWGGSLPGAGGGWEAPAPAPGWAAGPAAPPAAPSWGAAEPPWGAPPPREEPLQPRLPGDPFLGPRPPAAGTPGLPSGSGLPADVDPFAEGPPMPDHRPTASDAFLPPRPMQQVPVIPDDWDLGPTPSTPPAPPPAPGGGPARIPDDWNIDLSPAPAPPPRAPDPFAAPPPAHPAAQPAPRPAPPPPAPHDAFAAPPGPALGAPASPVAPAHPAAAAAPPSRAPAAGGAEAGLAAFLAGAGLPPHLAAHADPDAALRALGAAFHAAIAGLRQLLIARADVKREFRIEQTMLRSAGNNPVKFAASDEQALAALLAAGPQNGPRAVRETIEDLTAHQVATLAATQAAARALLARLAPEGLEAQEGGGGGLFASRDKRLWEAYKRLHQQVTEQFDDDFDSAFGKAFARAYEQASRRDG
jgi:type VI secretion system protein ImpI/type VI secretion system protein